MNWTYAWIVLIAAVGNIFFVLLLLAFLKKKFIPAADYISAVEVARRLQGAGFVPIINLLGEHLTNQEKIKQTFRKYLYLIDLLSEAGIKGKISVKPTQVGLAVSKEIYCDYLCRLCRRARNQKILVEVDMESLKYIDNTLFVFREIPGEYGARQAVQAYLRRSEEDIKTFIYHHRKIRLVKGAYAEGDLNKSETRTRMKNFMEQLLLYGSEPAIATIKDEELINDIIKFTNQHGIPKNRFIIQTLYGIRDDLKEKWRDEGFRVEVYVPVGRWYKALPYIWRRIREIKFLI